MSILISGAAGFIGSNFVLDWLSQGYQAKQTCFMSAIWKTLLASKMTLDSFL
jgi:nucleoside-diphosphate-sugar epimerase